MFIFYDIVNVWVYLLIFINKLYVLLFWLNKKIVRIFVVFS